MRIGVCDDEKVFGGLMREICEKTAQENGWNCEVIEYTSGEAVLEEKEELDVLILDIDMPGMNGIEVKQRLLRRQADTVIIFATFYHSYAMEAFGINVHGFVSKGKMEEELPRYLKSAIKMINDYIVLENGVRSKDIMYIKSDHVYANIFMINGECRWMRTSLDKLEQQLSGLNFVRAHKSYLVNMEWVCGKGPSYLLVGDKMANRTEKVPIAVRRKDDVQAAHEDYMIIIMKRCFGR